VILRLSRLIHVCVEEGAAWNGVTEEPVRGRSDSLIPADRARRGRVRGVASASVRGSVCGMSPLTKTKARKPVVKKPARKATGKRAARLVFRDDLPAISPDSPLYGKDDTIGAVSIGRPSDKASRRQHIRARVYADNHS